MRRESGWWRLHAFAAGGNMSKSPTTREICNPKAEHLRRREFHPKFKCWPLKLCIWENIKYYIIFPRFYTISSFCIISPPKGILFSSNFTELCLTFFLYSLLPNERGLVHNLLCINFLFTKFLFHKTTYTSLKLLPKDNLFILILCVCLNSICYHSWAITRTPKIDT